MTPAGRISLRDMLSPSEMAAMYGGMHSDRKSGPRLTREEWDALDAEGQNILRSYLPAWETAIVDVWSAQSKLPEKSPNDAWPSREFVTNLVWSAILPPYGVYLYLTNHRKEPRLMQTLGILIVSVASLLFAWPPVWDFLVG